MEKAQVNPCAFHFPYNSPSTGLLLLLVASYKVLHALYQLLQRHTAMLAHHPKGGFLHHELAERALELFEVGIYGGHILYHLGVAGYQLLEPGIRIQL